MIAIKGMYMPKGCASCPITSKICSAFALDKELKKEDLKISRHPNCPLIELPEENKDMSWEELKIKCDNLTTDIQFSSDGFDFECKGIWFNKVGTIFSSKLNIEDLKPFEMYQIIKALIGDER